MSLADVDPQVKARLDKAQDVVFNYEWWRMQFFSSIEKDYILKALSFVDELKDTPIDEDKQWHYEDMHIFAIGREIILCFGGTGYGHWLTNEEMIIKDIIE